MSGFFYIDKFLKHFLRFYSKEDTGSQEGFNIADALNSHVPEMAIRACSTTTMDSDNVDQVLKPDITMSLVSKEVGLYLKSFE